VIVRQTELLPTEMPMRAALTLTPILALIFTGVVAGSASSRNIRPPASLFGKVGEGEKAAICFSGETPAKSRKNIGALVLDLVVSDDSYGHRTTSAVVRVRMRDSAEVHQTELSCSERPGVDRYLCYVPCGDGWSLNLAIRNGGKATADLTLDKGVFPDTQGTGTRPERVKLTRVPADQCQSAPQGSGNKALDKQATSVKDGLAGN
jgi:hypothetical protein